MKTLFSIAIILFVIVIEIGLIALIRMFIGYYFKELIEDPDESEETVEESSDEGVE